MKNVYQMDMFGGPDEKIKKKRKRMSDKEKEERREKRLLDKKIKAEKEFEDKMASIGHPQLYMFDDNGNTIQNNNESKEYKKQPITIIWLDDIRDPNKYFNKNNKSNTFQKNSEYYNNIFSQYSPQFIWVKNKNEFVNYITNNSIPDMISFDHDLGIGLEKGSDCARWFVEYCKKNNIKMPKMYIHSANPNGQREINNIINKNLTSENMKTNKKTIKLSENEFHKLIKESVKKALLGENAYANAQEVRAIFENFGEQIGKLISEHQISKEADMKIGRLIHALETLVIDSINDRNSITTTWGIDKLDI